MKRLALSVGVAIGLVGCASTTAPTVIKYERATMYVDSDSTRPDFPDPEHPYEGCSVAIRDLDGKLRCEPSIPFYVNAAIYLAKHSTTKVAATSRGPRGRGCIFELRQHGKLLDWFVLWRDEVVVHGQRWLIEDRRFARDQRMQLCIEYEPTDRNEFGEQDARPNAAEPPPQSRTPP